MAVVGDEQDGSLELLQRLFKHVGACDIQMVGGFVQAQQGLGRDQHLSQRQAALLAAGKHGHLLIHGIAFEQESAQK